MLEKIASGFANAKRLVCVEHPRMDVDGNASIVEAMIAEHYDRDMCR